MHINIEATSKTPRILFNPEERIFEIHGNSRPENVRDFYYPVVKAIEEHFEDIHSRQDEDLKQKPYNFHFQMGYFNSASAKFLADIFLHLSEYKAKGLNNIRIMWYYEEGDEDMLEAGHDFSEMTHMAFSYVMIRKETR